MVEFFGTLARSRVEDGEQVNVFRIPAFSSQIAKQRARANARLKGLSEFTIDDVVAIDSTQVPGQTIYEVEVRA